jgi:hypothetical protein
MNRQTDRKKRTRLLYTAFLLTLVFVVPAVAGTEMYNISVSLEDGWNLFSTPVTLQPGKDTIPVIFETDLQSGITIILGWNGNSWFIPDQTFRIIPLNAIFVKTSGGADALLTPSQQVSSPPARMLQPGLNLIGPAPSFEAGQFPAQDIEGALITIEEVAGGLPGYSMVISPGLGQPGWVYATGMASRDLLPFKGYWVIMENSGTLAGFSTTPLPI